MSTTETKACGMCHCSDCDQCFPPMTVDEFLRRLDVRKQEEQNVRRNPVLAVTVVRALKSERDEAVALLRDLESRAHDNAGELDPEDYVHGGLIRIRDDARAFLARLDGAAK